MTQTQNDRIRALIVAELKRMVSDALDAGADPAAVQAELIRRIELLKTRTTD